MELLLSCNKACSGARNAQDANIFSVNNKTLKDQFVCDYAFSQANQISD
jgi:hypothetical protein